MEIFTEELIVYINNLLPISIDEKTIFFEDFEQNGITIPDIVFLMEDIEDKYAVDMSDLNIDKFAYSEIIRLRDIFSRKKKQIFTIHHLVDVINNGKWFDPPTTK